MSKWFPYSSVLANWASFSWTQPRCTLKGTYWGGCLFARGEQATLRFQSPRSSLSSQEDRCTLQPDSFLDDLLTQSLGEIQSFLPSGSCSFCLLILTDGLLGGRVNVLPRMQRMPRSTSYCSIPVVRGDDKRDLLTPFILTDGPSPLSWEKLKNQSAFSLIPN